MSYITYDTLRRAASSVQEAEAMKYARVYSASTDRVFLSHSSADNDLIPGTVMFLKGYGVSVYVDDGDARLPKTPSVETAEKLKACVKQCPRFVVLVTPRSKDSRWIPWELGLADGSKGTPPVAVLPAMPSEAEEAWPTQEYLGLYPRIYKGRLRGAVSDEWLVKDPRDGSAWSLGYWLKASTL